MQLWLPDKQVQSKRTLGHYSAKAGEGIGIAEARAKARAWHHMVRLGNDPAVVAKEVRQANERAQAEKVIAAEREANGTFESLAETYLRNRTTKRRHDLDCREVRRTLIAAWGQRL